MILTARTSFILACIFLDALGIGLIVPVLPRLVGELAGSQDAQTLWYGLIMVSYGLMQFISAPILGALSDRIGRRPVLLAGILGLGIMFAVPAFTHSLPLILASRFAGGFLSANTAVAQAYVADITTGSARAAAFGKIGAMFGIGFVLGPALGGILGDSDPRWPFICACAISVANFLYGSLVLPESLSARDDAPMRFKTCNPIGAILRLLQSRDCLVPVIIIALTGLANSLLQSTWALYTEFRYGLTPLGIGLTIFALALSISLVQGGLLPMLLRSLSPRSIVRASLAIGTLTLCGIALSPAAGPAAVLCCLYALTGLSVPILTGFITSRIPETSQGAATGSIGSLNSLVGALAPIMGTQLLMISTRFAGTPLAGAPYWGAALLLAIALGLSIRYPHASY